jgi:hypothetical protein
MCRGCNEHSREADSTRSFSERFLEKKIKLALATIFNVNRINDGGGEARCWW